MLPGIEAKTIKFRKIKGHQKDAFHSEF